MLINTEEKNNMSNKKEKEVAFYEIDKVVNLYNELAERGEELESIDFIDQENFKFSNGTLFLFARLNKIKSFSTNSKNDNKRINRKYIPKNDYAVSLDNFQVRYEQIFYK
jgi:hypothetical protein